METTKVLITGGAGYIGSVLTKLLLERGFKVTVLDNLMYKQTSLLHLFSHPDFKFIKGDVRDTKLLTELVRSHHVIIPLAAIVGMPACDNDKQLASDINFEQIVDIINFSTPDQKIILPNTNSQYGSSTEIITEDSPFNPLSHYASTKCSAESYLIYGGPAGGPTRGISLRLATVFGVSPRMRQDLLVNDFVYRAVTDGFLVLFESHYIRNYIHVQDVARTFLFMIENYDKCVGQAFNVGLTSANMSKLQLAEVVKRHVPSLVIVENNFKQDFDQRNYVISNAKLEGKGWYPTYSLDDGILELIEAYQMIKPRNNREFTNL